jgi:hypothetical protein
MPNTQAIVTFNIRHSHHLKFPQRHLSRDGLKGRCLAHLLVERTETVHIVALQVILCLFRTHTAPPEPSPTCSLWSSATLLRAVRAVDRETARCMSLSGADLALIRSGHVSVAKRLKTANVGWSLICNGHVIFCKQLSLF